MAFQFMVSEKIILLSGYKSFLNSTFLNNGKIIRINIS